MEKAYFRRIRNKSRTQNINPIMITSHIRRNFSAYFGLRWPLLPEQRSKSKVLQLLSDLNSQLIDLPDDKGWQISPLEIEWFPPNEVDVSDKHQEKRIYPLTAYVLKLSANYSYIGRFEKYVADIRELNKDVGYEITEMDCVDFLESSAAYHFNKCISDILTALLIAHPSSAWGNQAWITANDKPITTATKN